MKIANEGAIQELRNEFEEYKQRACREYEQLVNESNLKIGQLGNTYSIDCEQLQRNIQAEKERALKVYEKKVEELETKYE